MAKYHGFEVKNVKTWVGMEGYGTRCDVWLNGKKLGTYTDNGDGGCPCYSFRAQELCDAVKGQCPELAWSAYGHDFEPDLDMLISRLLEMKDMEKEWKKDAKNGRGWLVIGDNIWAFDANILRNAKTDELVLNSLIESCNATSSVEAEIYTDAKDWVKGEPLVAEEEIEKIIVANREYEQRIAELNARYAVV